MKNPQSSPPEDGALSKSRMGHVIRVLLLGLKAGKARFGSLSLEKCESWRERIPERSHATWLHRSRTSRWVMEHRYYKFKRWNDAYEVEASQAAYWLMAEQYQVTEGRRSRPGL